MSSTRSEVSRLRAAGLNATQIAAAIGRTKGTVCDHLRRLEVPPDPKFSRRYDWALVQAYYDDGHSVTECMGKFGFSRKTFFDATLRGAVRTRPQAMPVEQLLAAPRNRNHLKRRLLKLGLKAPRCEICLSDDWLGRPISLQLHHVNGRGQDNRLENLQLLCPNCHSQTDTWGGRNRPSRDAHPSGSSN